MRHVLTALLIGAAGAAAAEGYAIYDLGEAADRAACMQQGTKVMGAWNRRNGEQGVVDPTDWIVYGWDLGPGDNDVLIMCPILRGDFVNAFLVVHGEGTDQERDTVADGLEALWFGSAR
jgi:hypothetical protein